MLRGKVTAPSVPKSDSGLEFGLGFADEIIRPSLMVVWELMKPSWCPSPNADSISRATQEVQRELNSDFNLRDLNIIYNQLDDNSLQEQQRKQGGVAWLGTRGLG